MIKAYPLEWPLGHPRTATPGRNINFKLSFSQARDNCLHQIKLLRGTDPVVSTDIPTRLDGMPYADAARRSMKSQGVAVYFTYNKEQVVFCCDKWDRVEHNMHAVGMSIEAIRGLDRWGVSEMLKRVFSGFEALPQSTEEWWQVLEVNESASDDEIKAAWRQKTLQSHPDRGGDVNQYTRFNAAYQKYQSTKLKL